MLGVLREPGGAGADRRADHDALPAEGDGRGAGHAAHEQPVRHDQPVLQAVQLGDLVEARLEDGEHDEDADGQPVAQKRERAS